MFEINTLDALVARSISPYRQVLRRALFLTGIGTAVGVALAIVAGRGLDAMLFGVPPVDLPTFAAVPAGLLLSAALACYIPARRAARIDPAVTLRE